MSHLSVPDEFVLHSLVSQPSSWTTGWRRGCSDEGGAQTNQTKPLTHGNFSQKERSNAKLFQSLVLKCFLLTFITQFAKATIYIEDLHKVVCEGYYLVTDLKTICIIQQHGDRWAVWMTPSVPADNNTRKEKHTVLALYHAMQYENHSLKISKLNIQSHS